MAGAVPSKSGESQLSLPCSPAFLRWRRPSRRAYCQTIRLIFIALACFGAVWCSAQSASDDSGVIRGVVINSVTHEPIGRALVSSPDHRFAMLTDSEGRFEFTVTKPDSSNDEDSNRPDLGPRRVVSNRPYTLTARKPGFLSDPNQRGSMLRNDTTKDLTIELAPEAVITGTVALPTSEAPDSISLQLFRRQIQDGRGRWVPAGGSRSMSDGQFRFADLQAGSYKLLTTELLDNDPLTSPSRSDPFSPDGSGPLYGYPPVFYQSASDFQSANPIHLTAGQTQTVNLSLVKQPYHRVKIPVVAPGNDESANGLNVTVYAGHKGPGFTLGYNSLHHAVEGMLPNGTYTVEVTSFRPNGASGSQTFTVKGTPVEGPAIVLAPNGLIAVNVKEEFTTTGHGGIAADDSGPVSGRTSVWNGPRRYLNVTLDSADDFGGGRSVSLRNPTGAQDDALVIEGAPAGRYWVRVQSSRGYPASIRSGNLDLQRQPLVVGVGGAASPIEITMRDDTAEISGRVEGITPPPQNLLGDGSGPGGSAPGGGGPGGGRVQTRAHIYCLPLPDSSGQFTELSSRPDGTFDSGALAPGAYRILAFDRTQAEFEYRNPEAMQRYESKGSVVRLAGGQKEHVTVQLNSSASNNDQSNELGNESSNE
jgi:hypothetical protein